MNERESWIFKFIMSGVITFIIVITAIVIMLFIERTNETETPNKEVGEYCYCVEKGVIFK